MAVIKSVEEKYMKEALKQAKKPMPWGKSPSAVSLYMKVRSSVVVTTGEIQTRIHWRTQRSQRSTKPAK